MRLTIALAGNPNSGKTTLFNLLTGSNQYVGNWPGVTVEKKEGTLRRNKDVTIADLPGIYSLSPYSPEEVIARTYLMDARPDAVINIVDGTNIERNLYLTTQLMDLGVPVVVAVNMMDAVQKSGRKLDTKKLSERLGCPVSEISALKNTGIDHLVELAVKAAQNKKPAAPVRLSEKTEEVIAKVEAELTVEESKRRWYALKLMEKDEKALASLPGASDILGRVKAVVDEYEAAQDDEAESLITSERYDAVSRMLKGSYTNKAAGELSVSDKIDRVVTNRFLALPIFAAVMVAVYYLAVTTVGGWATDWTNENLFGDGFFFLNRGAAVYEEKKGEYESAQTRAEAFLEAAKEKGLDAESPAFAEEAKGVEAEAVFFEEDGVTVEHTEKVTVKEYEDAVKIEEPDPKAFGPWVDGIPVMVSGWLEKANVTPWVQSLVVEGIVAGVGAVLGFVPQMLVLFFLLALLEACGYMARIAFIMDRIFRKFGLSGKSFIPMLIGTGCSVPAIMASRTIENERDRRMTITTTSFIPCGAKLPVIAMIAGALFGGAWWVSPSTYFIGVAAVVLSGIMLKKTRRFAGNAAPFVMELPAYRVPAPSTVLRSTWERGWSFIKKAGSIILLSSIFIWFISKFGIVDGRFAEVEDLNQGFAANIGGVFAWIFKPLGFGDWQSAVATVMGLVAKENVVSTFGILFGFAEVSENGNEIWMLLRQHYTALAGFSMLLFNLLCAPCFAAIGAIKREMNSPRWTWFAILYQTVLAYFVSLTVYQLGLLVTGGAFTLWTGVAFALIVLFGYLLFRPDYEKRAGVKPGD